MQLFDRIERTAEFIRGEIPHFPTIGIILGTGLGGLADLVEPDVELPYASIPGFPVSTVESHNNRLIFGKLGGKRVMLMAGRFHYYEGYNMDEITFCVRVMKALGVKNLLVSNAAGGMKKDYQIGDIALITDHINLFPEHPLRGLNDDRLGPRFPDMSKPYDPEMIRLAGEIAAETGLDIKTGVYAGIQGPTFETRAEYFWLRTIGADLVGMSTVPEVIVALHAGMKVFGASIVTDIGTGEETLEPITLEEVIAAANKTAPKLAALVAELVKRL